MYSEETGKCCSVLVSGLGVRVDFLLPPLRLMRSTLKLLEEHSWQDKALHGLCISCKSCLRICTNTWLSVPLDCLWCLCSPSSIVKQWDKLTHLIWVQACLWRQKLQQCLWSKAIPRMYTSEICGFSSANEQKNIMECGKLEWRLTDLSTIFLLLDPVPIPIAPLLPPCRFYPLLSFQCLFFKNEPPKSHFFNFRYSISYFSLSHVVLRSHRCEIYNVWSLAIVPTFSRLNSACSIPSMDRENKLSYLRNNCCKWFRLSVEGRRRRKTFSTYSPYNRHYESCCKNKIFQQLLKM